jgi:hypothetical protein
MANGAFKFKDNSGNVVASLSNSGSNIVISGGTLDLSGMTGLTLGNVTMSGTTENASTASFAPSYLLSSSFNSYTGTTNTVIGTLATTGSNQFKNDQTITGSLTVTGFIDAQELRTTYISSSILYRSGSTKFGDELIDIHSFSGSLLISGSLGINTTSTTHKLEVYGGEIGQQISFTKDAPSGAYGRLGQDSNGTFLSQNAKYDGSSWVRDNTGGVPMALSLHNGNGQYEFRIASNGTNPITWTNAMVITSNGDIGVGITPTTGNRFWVKGNDSTSSNTSIIAQNSTGSYLLFVRNDGNIGMGTNIPISRVDIRGSHTSGYGIINVISNNSSLISLDSTTTYDVRIRYKTGGVDKWFAGMYDSDTWELQKGSDNTTRLAVTQTGFVGVGTKTPSVNLHTFKTDDLTTVQVRSETDTSSVVSYVGLAPSVIEYYRGIATGVDLTIQTKIVSSGTGGNIVFAPNSPSLDYTPVERMRISKSGFITTPYQPAFYAYGVSQGSYLSGNYWVFPSTHVNRGSHYSTSTGVFTAPVAGVYFFGYGNLMGVNATVYRWRLYVNNTEVGATQLRMDRTGMSTSGYGWNHTRNFMINLNVGDTVRVYSASDDGSSLYPNGNDGTNEYPHFMGYLLG